MEHAQTRREQKILTQQYRICAKNIFYEQLFTAKKSEFSEVFSFIANKLLGQCIATIAANQGVDFSDQIIILVFFQGALAHEARG